MDLLGSSQVILLPPKNAPKMASALVLTFDHIPTSLVQRPMRCPISMFETRYLDYRNESLQNYSE
jgi:hypothetical protein